MKLKIISVLICVLFVFCSCGKEEIISSSEISSVVSNAPSSSNVSINESSSSSQATTSNESKQPPVSSEITLSTKPYTVESVGDTDLLSLVTDHGTSVVGYGELKNESYNSALKELETVLDNYSREISVVCYSLNNKKALSYNTNARLFCACTVKASFNLFACKEMDKGVASLDTVMTYEKKHYEPGTGDMQYSSYGTKFNMKTILHKSMSISDNVGYLMSVDYFGREKYNTFAENLGISSLKIKPTVWALKAGTKDLAITWREIYKYVNSNAKHAEFLYSTCTNTPDNYATLALGKKYTISHKQGHNNTADWPSYSDAGIVWKGNDAYIIAVITNSLGPNAESRKVMADTIKIIDEKLF